MLTAFKLFLKSFLAPVLYFGGIVTVIGTLFKRAEWGLFLLIVMIPQPNVWYKLQKYPLGHDFIDFLFFAVLFGIFIQKKGFEMTANGLFLLFFILVSYLALWNSSLRFLLPFPLTTANSILPDWKNYAEMIFLYFLALNLMKEEDQQKRAIVLMAVVILLIAIRSYRNFSAGDSFNYGKRAGGPFEAVGLGPNHFGAFIAYYCTAMLGLFLFDQDRKRRLLFLATYLFGLHPLLFSYSRGAYLGALGAITFMGVVKKRSLLIVVAIILIGWQTLLPVSVIDRIKMTENENGEIENSAAHRLDLWKHAANLFYANPVFGVGFGGFGFTVPQGELTDTHNFYMKTLSEQGVIGFICLVIVLLLALWSGWRLFRIGRSPFFQGLGFGFMGMVIACIISNLFGDRWSYFALGGYFWILWGMVDRAFIHSAALVTDEEEELAKIS